MARRRNRPGALLRYTAGRPEAAAASETDTRTGQALRQAGGGWAARSPAESAQLTAETALSDFLC